MDSDTKKGETLCAYAAYTDEGEVKASCIVLGLHLDKMWPILNVSQNKEHCNGS